MDRHKRLSGGRATKTITSSLQIDLARIHGRNQFVRPVVTPSGRLHTKFVALREDKPGREIGRE